MISYLRNLLDLILAHWLLRNLRREVKGMEQKYHSDYDCPEIYDCPICRKLKTIDALEAHIADLESKLK